ncbi:MAG: histone-lysine N-methyltransferase [bacterium]|nr:histone-lysine N-methyltransferase [bacterium]
MKRTASAGKRYPLRDVEEPLFFRDIFPYTEIPRVPFDGKAVPMEQPAGIWITDTTFRDGQQSRPPYTADQVVRIYRLLHELDGDSGVIRQCEFFLYSAADKEAVRRCMEIGCRYPEVTGWIRAKKEDFQLVREMGLRETGILTSCSDYHIFLKLHWTRRQAMDNYLGIVRAALDAGIIPRCHLEDATRADFYGFVVPFAQELMRLSDESGIPIKIRVCDTLGYGVPFAEAALPRSVPKLFHGLRREAGVPAERLEWHGHNDFHKVLVNAVAGWLYGCSAANGAILGFGERTGNPPLEGLVMEYLSLRGPAPGLDTTVITRIARYFQDEIGVVIPPNYPFVGLDFNTTKAGIHADGVLKNEEIYNPFDTVRLLRRPVRVSITDKSGIAGIAYWIDAYLGTEGDRRMDKRDPGLMRIKKRIDEEYAAGRTTGISDEEMLHFARIYLPRLFKSDFDRLKSRVTSMARHIVEEAAEREEIRSMDPARIEPLLRAMLGDQPFVKYLYVTDRGGRKITPNIVRPGDQETYDAYFTDGFDFSNRSWYLRPMETGESRVSDFYTSLMDGALCITVSAPVRGEDGTIAGVLGVDILFEDIAKM